MSSGLQEHYLSQAIALHKRDRVSLLLVMRCQYQHFPRFRSCLYGLTCAFGLYLKRQSLLN